MRILFHVTLPTMLRHFDSLLLLLADRGHEVRVAISRRNDLPLPESLTRHPRLSFVAAPDSRGDDYAEEVLQLRVLRDYLRYLENPYKGAVQLRKRAMSKLITTLSQGHQTHVKGRCPHCAARLVDEDMAGLMFPFAKEARVSFGRLLQKMEAAVPSAPAIEAFLRSERPDVVLVTPLINFASLQPDFVKSAKALGIPVGFPVFSWDNLSNKGVIQVQPDRVFVWNDWMRTEAVGMHGVDEARIEVTGAPRFDEFFAMRPSLAYDAFCDQHGFNAAEPTILYLCSSEFVARDERDFVSRWIDAVRADPSLARCNILVRPHPRERATWRRTTMPQPRVAVSLPRALNGDQLLRDVLEHSVAVVGLNTSAQIEAGIVGRPVFTIRVPEFAGGQEGTVHFHYLLKERGGFVESAPDLATHVGQLGAAVAGTTDAEAIRQFIERFIRPQGLSRPATPILADAIEALARTGAAGRAAVTA